YEFKTNHGEWITSVKPNFGDNVSGRVRTAIKSVPRDVKVLYKVRTELRSALQNLLKITSTGNMNSESQNPPKRTQTLPSRVG
ncbi:hypothetical protein SOVF_136220, partial [Spinacia oleracea]